MYHFNVLLENVNDRLDPMKSIVEIRCVCLCIKLISPILVQSAFVSGNCRFSFLGFDVEHMLGYETNFGMS
jgi:hypothetical protein